MDMSMHNLYSIKQIYYTDNSYYSSYPFPSEWIEFFGNSQQEIYEEEKLESEEDMRYKPVITPGEIFNVKQFGKKINEKTVVRAL